MDAGQAWTSLCREIQADRVAIRAGLPRAPKELATVTERALSLVEDARKGAADARDAPAQGALAALLLGRLREKLVPFWIALGGPAFAMACAMYERQSIATHARKGTKPTSPLDLGVRWLEPRPEDRIPVALDEATWETLSGAFRKLKKAERAAAQIEIRSELERARPALGLALWIDGVALLAAEAAAHTSRALRLDEPMRTELEPWVIAAVPALAEEPSKNTCAAVVEILEGAPVTIVNRIARHAKDVVSLLGTTNIRPLLEILSEAHKTSVVEATAAKRVAEAIAAGIDDAPIVMDFFRRHIESRLIGGVAAAYVVTKKKKDDGVAPARAAEILEQVTEEKKVRSKRAKKAAKKVATTRKRSRLVAQAPEAKGDEIPWILREPPWRHPNAIPPLPRSPTTKARRIAKDGDDRLHLTDDDRAGIAEGDEVDADDAVGMLASRGLAALPAIFAMPIGDAIHGLRHVESPRVVPRMLEALATPRRAVAQAYLRKFPEVSAIALLAMVLDERSSDKQRVALEAMNLLIAEGEEKTLHAAAAELGISSDIMPAILGAARLLDLPSETPSVPSWVDQNKLPQILLRKSSASGKPPSRLPTDAGENLLELLTFPNTKRPHVAALQELRLSLDQVALDVFLSGLLDAWIRSKSWTDEWVLFAVGALGGADAHRAIMQRAKEWNREHGTRERALMAIRALGAGGVSAVSPLIELTRKGGSTSLTECANEVLSSLARRERLSTDELADIAIPTLDLDPRGCVSLDFGPRTFEVRLGDDLTAQIFDAHGQRVPTALRALASDDPVKAQMSLERLRSLKKGMGEVARNVAGRLELAMITGRTWRGQSFRTTVVDHPLLGRIARRLLWSKRSRGSSTASDDVIIRIAEDGTAADASDELIDLDDADVIRLIHTLDFDFEGAKTKVRWAEIFAEYEIIQPFPQIDRATFTPTAAEMKADELSRFQGVPAMQMAIQGRLMARGWERVSDGWTTSGYVRRLRSVTAEYTLVHPLEMGEDFMNETKLGTVRFGVALNNVPPLVFSEIAYDLHVLAEEKVK